MQEELNHLVVMDNNLAKILMDSRNLQSQLYSERVSMLLASATRKNWRELKVGIIHIN
jgi:hypothetical protein